MKNTNKRKWTVELTEEQLHIIAECVEDCHRFASGQCDMSNITARLDNMWDIRTILRQVESLVPHSDWAGNGIKDYSQKRFVAMTYGIYREILHQLLQAYPSEHYSVLDTPTLTCEDQGGLPIVKPKDKQI